MIYLLIFFITRRLHYTYETLEKLNAPYIYNKHSIIADGRLIEWMDDDLNF